MAIYGVKCNIPKDEVKEDRLEVYDCGYYNFTINDIEKIADIRIERNPDDNPIEIERALIISRPTVYKYL